MPFDAICTDTTGPITPKDPRGNRSFRLLFDSATGLMHGESLRHKNEATKAVGKYIKTLQVTIDHEVKRYHSRNTVELKHKNLLDVLRNQGTPVTSTTPHSSQQNGLVERRVIGHTWWHHFSM